MNYEEFKEQIVDDVKQELENRGIDANISIQKVKKMNESYEAVTLRFEEGLPLEECAKKMGISAAPTVRC